jgi:hypothetical protein
MDGLGLEIGPSYAPVAPKAHGFKVHILDHTDRAGLIEKYPANNHALIEEVDFVWNGEPYRELVGSNRYQWIIASHVIEHMPDLIGFLADCEGILEADGILSLVVPDKRFCFDRLRALTGIGQVIEAQGRMVSSVGSVYDYFSSAALNGDLRLWNTNEDATLALMMPDAFAVTAYRRALAGHPYDVHAWTFTPTSFRLILQDLADLGLTVLREIGHHPTEGGEFFATLSKQGGSSRLDRLAALKAIEEETRTI